MTLKSNFVAASAAIAVSLASASFANAAEAPAAQVASVKVDRPQSFQGLTNCTPHHHLRLAKLYPISK